MNKGMSCESRLLHNRLVGIGFEIFLLDILELKALI